MSWNSMTWRLRRAGNRGTVWTSCMPYALRHFCEAVFRRRHSPLTHDRPGLVQRLRRPKAPWHRVCSTTFRTTGQNHSFRLLGSFLAV